MLIAFLSGFLKSFSNGLRGDRDFNFTDFLQLAKIPYWLGGIGLVAVFAAVDRIGLNGTKAGAAVALYMGGKAVADLMIDSVFKARYGMNMDLSYRDPEGRINKVFASTEFPRIDLLKDKHYHHIADKLGIPTFVADRTKAVKEQIPLNISQNRVLKLVLGNTLAMVGAGYLSRSDAWASVLKLPQEIGHALAGKGNGGLVNRIVSATQIAATSLAEPFKERLFGLPNEASPWLRRTALGVMGAGALFTLWQSLNVVRKREYEASSSLIMSTQSPFVSILKASNGGVQG